MHFRIKEIENGEWEVHGANTGYISTHGTRERAQEVADELNSEAETEHNMDMLDH